jgi:50S ribosomal protein L16 3-hydroxylase
VRELGSEFLGYLQDRLALPDTLYADPDLAPTRAPARLDNKLVDRCIRMLERVRWSRGELLEFLGRHFSEPKPHVRFTPPRRPLAAAAFARACAQRASPCSGDRDALPCEPHVHQRRVGRCAARMRAALTRLADRRVLAARASITPQGAALLYTWYRTGYLAPVPR